MATVVSTATTPVNAADDYNIQAMSTLVKEMESIDFDGKFDTSNKLSGILSKLCEMVGELQETHVSKLQARIDQQREKAALEWGSSSASELEENSVNYIFPQTINSVQSTKMTRFNRRLDILKNAINYGPSEISSEKRDEILKESREIFKDILAHWHRVVSNIGELENAARNLANTFLTSIVMSPSLKTHEFQEYMTTEDGFLALCFLDFLKNVPNSALTTTKKEELKKFFEPIRQHAPNYAAFASKQTPSSARQILSKLLVPSVDSLAADIGYLTSQMKFLQQVLLRPLDENLDELAMSGLVAQISGSTTGDEVGGGFLQTYLKDMKILHFPTSLTNSVSSHATSNYLLGLERYSSSDGANDDNVPDSNPFSSKFYEIEKTRRAEEAASAVTGGTRADDAFLLGLGRGSLPFGTMGTFAEQQQQQQQHQMFAGGAAKKRKLASSSSSAQKSGKKIKKSSGVTIEEIFDSSSSSSDEDVVDNGDEDTVDDTIEANRKRQALVAAAMPQKVDSVAKTFDQVQQASRAKIQNFWREIKSGLEENLQARDQIHKDLNDLFAPFARVFDIVPHSFLFSFPYNFGANSLGDICFVDEIDDFRALWTIVDKCIDKKSMGRLKQTFYTDVCVDLQKTCMLLVNTFKHIEDSTWSFHKFLAVAAKELFPYTLTIRDTCVLHQIFQKKASEDTNPVVLKAKEAGKFDPTKMYQFSQATLFTHLNECTLKAHLQTLAIHLMGYFMFTFRGENLDTASYGVEEFGGSSGTRSRVERLIKNIDRTTSLYSGSKKSRKRRGSDDSGDDGDDDGEDYYGNSSSTFEVLEDMARSIVSFQESMSILFDDGVASDLSDDHRNTIISVLLMKITDHVFRVVNIEDQSVDNSLVSVDEPYYQMDRANLALLKKFGVVQVESREEFTPAYQNLCDAASTFQNSMDIKTLEPRHATENSLVVQSMTMMSCLCSLVQNKFANIKDLFAGRVASSSAQILMTIGNFLNRVYMEKCSSKKLLNVGKGDGAARFGIGDYFAPTSGDKKKYTSLTSFLVGRLGVLVGLGENVVFVVRRADESLLKRATATVQMEKLSNIGTAHFFETIPDFFAASTTQPSSYNNYFGDTFCLDKMTLADYTTYKPDKSFLMAITKPEEVEAKLKNIEPHQILLRVMEIDEIKHAFNSSNYFLNRQGLSVVCSEKPSAALIGAMKSAKGEVAAASSFLPVHIFKTGGGGARKKMQADKMQLEELEEARDELANKCDRGLRSTSWIGNSTDDDVSIKDFSKIRDFGGLQIPYFDFAKIRSALDNGTSLGASDEVAKIIANIDVGENPGIMLKLLDIVSGHFKRRCCSFLSTLQMCADDIRLVIELILLENLAVVTFLNNPDLYICRSSTLAQGGELHHLNDVMSDEPGGFMLSLVKVKRDLANKDHPLCKYFAANPSLKWFKYYFLNCELETTDPARTSINVLLPVDIFKKSQYKFFLGIFFIFFYHIVNDKTSHFSKTSVI